MTGGSRALLLLYYYSAITLLLGNYPLKPLELKIRAHAFTAEKDVAEQRRKGSASFLQLHEFAGIFAWRGHDLFLE